MVLADSKCFANSGSAPHGVVFQQIMRQGYEGIRMKRLQTEHHVQSFILVFGVRQSTEHNDRYVDMAVTHRPYKFRPIHARHQVVCNDQPNGVLILCIQHSECLDAARGYLNCRAGPLKDDPPCCSLHRIIVYKKYLSMGHS